MKLSLKTLNVALFAIGIGSIAGTALAEARFYDPSNEAAASGYTTGYQLNSTIGCPGRQLLDPPCKQDIKPAVVAVPEPKAAPAPVPVAAANLCALPVGAVSGRQMPTNAQVGECFAKIAQPATFRTENIRKRVKEASERIDIVPAVYETVKERVLIKEASERIEIVPPVYKAVKVHVQSEEVQVVVPAVYETVRERALLKDASTRLVEVPAVYESVEERIMVKPATQKAIEVPALYESVTEKKLVREAYTSWVPGTQTNIQRFDATTGQIMCLIEVPAEYQTITRQVLKSPAAVRYEDIPAEYQMVSKTVLKTPTTTTTVQVPAEYAEREVTKLITPATTVTKVVPVDYEREIMTMVQPATEKRVEIPAVYTEREVNKLMSPAREVRVPIPAEYANVAQEVLVCSDQEYWTKILCDINASPEKIAEIQKALQTAGFYPGFISGRVDAMTMNAVAAFQKARGLPVDGYINVETVKALGVSPQ